MKKERAKKTDLFIIIVVVVLFCIVSIFSIYSIQQLHGNARVVNYVGIVRGATQKLVKKELMGYPDEALVQRLDGIVEELITGEGQNGLIVLPDEEFLGNMHEVQAFWGRLKEEIAAVRGGADKTALFEMSEKYFDMVDMTVSSAEAYSERQVQQTTNILIGANIVFVACLVLAVGSHVRAASLRKKADALGKIAYVDPLTQMPNRASCEREIDRLKAGPPAAMLAVFMFDMNNLKLANDQLGHQGGDRIIADFARVLRTQAEGFGFVGRYGGDEFLAIFENADDAAAGDYLLHVNEKIVAYNLLHVNDVEKISFAVGYIIGDMRTQSLEDMINEADRRMYAKKRQMKGVAD